MPKDPPKGPKGGTSMFTPGGLRRTYVYLDPETREALRELGHARETSISALIAQAVEEFLERQARDRKPSKP